MSNNVTRHSHQTLKLRFFHLRSADRVAYAFCIRTRSRKKLGRGESRAREGSDQWPSLFVVEGMDPDSLSKAFVEHYYTTFDSNRLNLMGLYQESSMLSFEGEKIQGAQNISNKLNSLPFQQCKHNISTVDCQPSGPAGGMLVFVSGNLQLPGEEHALKFSQVGFLKAGSLLLLVRGLLSLSVEKIWQWKYYKICRFICLCSYLEWCDSLHGLSNQRGAGLGFRPSRLMFTMFWSFVHLLFLGRFVTTGKVRSGRGMWNAAFWMWEVVEVFEVRRFYVLVLLQMFHLIPTAQGSFYVFNDIFRLNYA